VAKFTLSAKVSLDAKISDRVRLMKNLKILFFVLITGLCSAQEIRIRGVNPPAEDVYDEIIAAEKILQANENGTSAPLCKIYGIIALSKITPKVWDGTYFGSIYRPSHEEIQLWKEWFDKNRFYLSYDPLNERYKDILGNEKIIVLKLPDGTVRKSRTEKELESLEKIYQHTQNNTKNKTN